MFKKWKEKIKELIKKGKRIKAAIITDYAGHPCDWKNKKTFIKNISLRL